MQKERVFKNAKITSSKSKFNPISSTLLNEYETTLQKEANAQFAEETEKFINDFFINHNCNAWVGIYIVGDSITKYIIRYGADVKKRHLQQIKEELESTIKGTTLKIDDNNGDEQFPYIELINKMPSTVSFKELYENLPDYNDFPLVFAFGKDVTGNHIIGDLNNISNMFIIGEPDSGDSVFIESIITTLIMRNSSKCLKIALFDSDNTKFSRFANIPHLLCPIIYKNEESKKADELLREADRRYSLFRKYYQKNIDEYNEDAKSLGLEQLPHIVVIIKDLFDFNKAYLKDLFIGTICTLANCGKEAGIHIVVDAHFVPKNVGMYPRVQFSNIIAFKNSTGLISKDEVSLGGCGDMLIESREVFGDEIKRIQGCFIHRKEIERVIDAISKIKDY